MTYEAANFHIIEGKVICLKHEFITEAYQETRAKTALDHNEFNYRIVYKTRCKNCEAPK